MASARRLVKSRGQVLSRNARRGSHSPAPPAVGRQSITSDPVSLEIVGDISAAGFTARSAANSTAIAASPSKLAFWCKPRMAATASNSRPALEVKGEFTPRASMLASTCRSAGAKAAIGMKYLSSRTLPRRRSHKARRVRRGAVRAPPLRHRAGETASDARRGDSVTRRPPETRRPRWCRRRHSRSHPRPRRALVRRDRYRSSQRAHGQGDAARGRPLAPRPLGKMCAVIVRMFVARDASADRRHRASSFPRPRARRPPVLRPVKIADMGAKNDLSADGNGDGVLLLAAKRQFRRGDAMDWRAAVARSPRAQPQNQSPVRPSAERPSRPLGARLGGHGRGIRRRYP